MLTQSTSLAWSEMTWVYICVIFTWQSLLWRTYKQTCFFLKNIGIKYSYHFLGLECNIGTFVVKIYKFKNIRLYLSNFMTYLITQID